MKKGFTLVELLAVIVILSVIAIITIPLIGNVIEESKKKALEQSAYGLVEAADYYALENEGEYSFLFDNDHKGENIDKTKQLDYKGSIEGEGKLYIDNNGDISLCINTDKYYVIKNYNSGIEIKDRNEYGCNIEQDPLTNKYVAYLDNGTGQVSNVYSKDEIDNLLAPITKDITDIKADLEDAYSTALSNQTNIGTLNSLTTTNKTDLVSAINEVNSSISTANTNIATVTSKVDKLYGTTTQVAWNTKQIIIPIPARSAYIGFYQVDIYFVGNASISGYAQYIISPNGVISTINKSTNASYVVSSGAMSGSNLVVTMSAEVSSIFARVTNVSM